MKKALPTKLILSMAAKPASSGLFRSGFSLLQTQFFATILFCYASSVLFSTPVFAAKKPTIEVGILAAGQVLKDYRGSAQTDSDGIVIPVFIYRGDWIKIDRNGIRGDLVSTPRFEVNVSGEASLGGGRNNELRRGMPELDRAIEFGPSFNINLTGKTFDEGLSLRLPIRGVSTFNSDGFDYIGYVFNPRFTYRIPDMSGWRTSFNAGALFGSDKYHDFYYRVAPEFVTDDRSLYDASSGFSGWYSKASFSRRYGSFLYGLNLRYDNLSGASFIDSPLIETKHYFSFGFGVIWFFWDSDK